VIGAREVPARRPAQRRGLVQDSGFTCCSARMALLGGPVLCRREANVARGALFYWYQARWVLLKPALLAGRTGSGRQSEGGEWHDRSGVIRMAFVRCCWTRSARWERCCVVFVLFCFFFFFLALPKRAHSAIG